MKKLRIWHLTPLIQTVLHLKGVEFDQFRMQDCPAFRNLKQGPVPVLQDGEIWVLYEPIILMYLDRRCPEPPLFHHEPAPFARHGSVFWGLYTASRTALGDSAKAFKQRLMAQTMSPFLEGQHPTIVDAVLAVRGPEVDAWWKRHADALRAYSESNRLAMKEGATS